MTATDIETESVAAVPRALRPGFSIGQGLAAVVIAVGALLLLNATAVAQTDWGTGLLIGGVVLLAAVETLRIIRRRGVAQPED